MSLLAVSVCACSQRNEAGFVKQNAGRFEIDGKPYYFVGTNFWYGAILGSTGQGGNRDRLLRELDFLKSIGINNLRVLVGADGLAGQKVKVQPTLQQTPGVYNDTIFDGLDFMLAEMGKREMYAVLFLNNSWEWSGGYGQYLSWAGRGDVVPEGVQNWTAFCEHVAQYADCDDCHKAFLAHVKTVIARTNRYSGKKYTDDPAIMAWQVGNEPRAFSDAGKPAFVNWLKETTALIRSLDKNHLISLGNEGLRGCEEDMALYETIHADPNVDYLTIHIWPKNWDWIKIPDVTNDIDVAIAKTNEYIGAHIPVAEKLAKPMVIEEFGYPRDHHKYTLDDPTSARDAYYENIISQVAKSSAANGALSGCAFWAWGGFGRASHTFWEAWDDYLGDPSQEEQGLNAVVDVESTIEVIKKYTAEINIVTR
jgi:mannan endo-1,4-beta-mannosidase